MAKFGFIGFGSMAKMLINGLINYADVQASDIKADSGVRPENTLLLGY